MHNQLRRLTIILVLLSCTMILLAETTFPVVEEQLQVTASQDQKGIRIQPRSIQMAVFFINNMTDQSQLIRPEFTLPVGWNPIMPPFPVTIAAGERQPVYFSYQVPETALGGEQEIICSITQPDGTVVSDSQIVFVEYLYKIQLSLMKSGLYVEAGESYTFDVLLKNESNIGAEFSLLFEEGFGYGISPDKNVESLFLEPQELVAVTIEVKTSKEIEEMVLHEVQVSAQILDQNISRTESTSMEIIPSIPGESAYHMYPISIKMRSSVEMGDELNNINSISITGSGSIRDDGSHVIDFSIKPPSFPFLSLDLTDTSVSLSYEHEGLFLYSGTQRSFPIVGLSLSSLSGLGIGTHYQLDDHLRIEGILVDPSSDDDESSFGFGIENVFSDGNNISLGFRAPIDAPEDGFLGMMTHFKPYGTATISGAALMSIEDSAAFSYQISAADSERLYDYALSRSFKSAAYAESEQGIDTYSLTGSMRVIPNLKISGSFDRNMNNISLIQSVSTSLTTQTIKFGVYWLPASNLSIQLNQEFYRQWDLLEQVSLQTLRDTTSLRFSYRKNKISLTPSVSIKSMRNTITGMTYSSMVSRINCDYTLNPRARFSSSVIYDSGANDPGITDSILSWSLATVLNPDIAVGVTAGFSQTYYPFEPDDSISSLRFGMTLQKEAFGALSFNFLHTLEHEIGAISDVTVSIVYALPLTINIPVSLRTDVGSLEGVIYHKDTNLPLKRVLVTVGDMSVLTDDEGRYSFKALPPGEVTIGVSAPDHKDYIVAGKYPLELTIEKSGSHIVDIPMVEKATISGNVLRFEKKPGTGFFMIAPEYYKDGGFSGLVVELTGEFGVRREATKNDGTFSFTSVVPGAVQLRVYTEQLPDTHELVENLIEFTLEPGESSSHDFEVKPIVRLIQFVQEGVIAID